MSTYAIVETGSKQYRVEPESVIEVDKLELPENKTQVVLDRVLFVRDGETVKVGTPLVAGAQVVCDYLGDFKGEKGVAFFYRPKKDSKSKKGYRHTFSRLEVKEIKVT